MMRRQQLSYITTRMTGTIITTLRECQGIAGLENDNLQHGRVQHGGEGSGSYCNNKSSSSSQCCSMDCASSLVGKTNYERL
jgi:hypothetical protein